METKKIEIQQAMEGEKFNKTLLNFEEFKQELAINNINDIFAHTVKIKQDKTKYIFSTNNKNIFAIEGKTALVNRIQKFYKEKGVTEERTAEQQVLIRMEGLELQYIKSKTQEELDMLLDDIKSIETSIERATDIENVKYKVERLISFFEQEKDLAKDKSSGSIFNQAYDRKDKNLRKVQKTEVKRRLKELNKIKKQIERLESNKGKTYTIKRKGEEIEEVKMDDINGMDMTTTLRQLSERIEKLGKEAPDFITSRNDIVLEKGDTTPYYEIIIHDKNDAEKLKKSLKKINNEYILLDRLELNTAQKQELSQDLQGLEAYLNAVISNPDTFRPSELPFVPTHKAEFAQLIQMDPLFKEYTILNNIKREKNTQGNNLYVNTRTELDGDQQRIDNGDQQRIDNADPSYTGYKDAVEKNGIRGAIYQTFNYFPNMKAEQKSFWTNALFLGGMGFLLFKAGKWLFTGRKNKEGNKVGPGFWGRLAIIGGVALGTNMLTGKSPLELIDKAINGGFKFKDIKLKFREKSENASEDANTFVVNPLTATLLVGNNKISDLSKIIDIKTFKFKDYDTLLNTAIATGNTDMEELLKKIGKDDKNNILKNGLAQLGINENTIEGLDQNKTVDEYYAIYMQNIETAETYRLRNNLVIKKGKEEEFKKLLINNKQLTEADIEKANKEFGLFEVENRVDSQETKTAKELLHKQIDELQGITVDTTAIKTGIDTFYDIMPKDTEGKKKLQIIQEGATIYLQSYGQKTAIELNQTRLKKFSDTTGAEYIFPSYTDLFASTNLTNRLKEIFQDNTAKSEKPFHIDTLTGNIEFDNTKRYEFWRLETTAISGGWFTSKLSTVSQTLEDHKQEYCDYLNSLHFWKTEQHDEEGHNEENHEEKKYP